MNKLIPLSLMGVMIIKILTPIEIHSAEHQKMTIESEKVMTVKSKENALNNEKTVQSVEENNIQNTEIVQNQAEQTSTELTTYETRMTSYYPNDGPGTGSITGSGLGPNDFEINEHGWYTYQGKLVVATATDYLISRFGLGDGVHTYKYWDEITLTIDGVDYQAIVLDSCGHAMHSGRIDLFVSGSWAVKDTMITVKE